MTGELPAWLTAMVDQRLALIEHAKVNADKLANIIMTPLTEPGENPTTAELEYWELSCDNCGEYCTPGVKNFYTGTVHRRLKNGTPVYFSFGVCEACKW